LIEVSPADGVTRDVASARNLESGVRGVVRILAFATLDCLEAAIREETGSRVHPRTVDAGSSAAGSCITGTAGTRGRRRVSGNSRAAFYLYVSDSPQQHVDEERLACSEDEKEQIMAKKSSDFGASGESGFSPKYESRLFRSFSKVVVIFLSASTPELTCLAKGYGPDVSAGFVIPELYLPP
jgi:hypothetical protein